MAKHKAALLFLAVAATAHAECTILSADSEPGRTGVVHRHLVLEDSQTNESATVDLALFSSKSCTLRVIDQPTPPADDLARAMAQEKCLAGVNGGYFDPSFGPIGLRIINGKTLAPLVRARLITGVLLASPHGVQIVRIGEFSRKQKTTAAIQCGPFLVDGGQRVRGLDDSRPARRTFAAIGTESHAALGVCSEVSLAELANILATNQLAEDLKIQRAINLDGGSSSAFWFAHESGGAFSISEQKNVRDFVGIVAK